MTGPRRRLDELDAAPYVCINPATEAVCECGDYDGWEYEVPL